MRMHDEVRWRDTVGEFEIVTVRHKADSWTSSIYLPRTAASSVAPVRRLYADNEAGARDAHKRCVCECKLAYKEQDKR